MLQNLDISDTLVSLGTFLKNDPLVQGFCDENFTSALSIYVGDFTRKSIPTAANCPYIVLTDFQKKEGQNIEFCGYRCTAFIGLSTDALLTEDENEDDEETVVDEDGILMLDIFDVGAKFMTLIEAVFNDKTKRNRPLSRCNTDGPYPLDTKHWIGRMELTWRIYQTLGTTYQEEL